MGAVPARALARRTWRPPDVPCVRGFSSKRSRWSHHLAAARCNSFPRHAGLVPASNPPRALAPEAHWTPERVRGDELRRGRGPAFTDKRVLRARLSAARDARVAAHARALEPPAPYLAMLHLGLGVASHT